MAKNTDQEQTFKLEVENELRVLTGAKYLVTISISSGLAEIFGTEMELNKVYSLAPNSSINVYTWQGCILKVSGKPEAAFVVNKTAMMLNVVLHASLEERRLQAEALNKKGPVTLVVGTNDKSSLCRLLLNYAVRMGRRPLFIDLDVENNSLAIPGTIGFLTVEKPADIVNGFDNIAAHVYEFGYKNTASNIILYFLLLKRLRQIFQSDIIQTKTNVKNSGVIINSSTFSTDDEYDAISLVAKDFNIDILCVVEDEDLYLKLQRDLPSHVEMYLFPKVFSFSERLQPDGVKDYFFGKTRQGKTFVFKVVYSEIKVFKVVILFDDEPCFRSVKEKDAILDCVPLDYNLVDQILGVSNADTVEENIIFEPIIGSVWVQEIDTERDTITFLAPWPCLPKTILLMGDYKYPST